MEIVLSSFQYPPSPPFQCWKMTEQLRIQTAQFYTTLNHGGGERTKREVKSANFPTLLTMIVDKRGGIMIPRKSVVNSIECLKNDLDLVDIWRVKNQKS